MASLAPLIYIVCLISMVRVSSSLEQNNCSCFQTNGSSAGYFTSHEFYDFRNVETTLLTVPPIIVDATETANASFTSGFLASDPLTTDWEIQNWNNSDKLDAGAVDDRILMLNSLNNVYIEPSDDDHPDYNSYLTLRTARQLNFQSAAEIDSSQAKFHYLSARFLARVIGSPGACAGMFTYLAGSGSDVVQEADIEILTSGPRNAVQFTNQPSSQDGKTIPKSTQNKTLPGKKDWTKWHVYRLDWMPAMTTWYVNNEKVSENAFQVPRDPSRLIFNIWSDGGRWTGNMTLYDQAYLQIQWIEIAYNTSEPYAGDDTAERDQERSNEVQKNQKHWSGCKVVCGIDEPVNVTGTPQFLYESVGVPRVGEVGSLQAMLWLSMLLGNVAVVCAWGGNIHI